MNQLVQSLVELDDIFPMSETCLQKIVTRFVRDIEASVYIVKGGFTGGADFAGRVRNEFVFGAQTLLVGLLEIIYPIFETVFFVKFIQLIFDFFKFDLYPSNICNAFNFKVCRSKGIFDQII